MRVLVLAYGEGNAASTQYRYGACRSLWATQGHTLDIVGVRNAATDGWRRLRAYDVIINQKALLPRRLGRYVFRAAGAVFFDFDDAIWTRPQRPYSWWTQWRVNRRIRYWWRQVQGIFVANEHLAVHARRYNAHVDVIPMALDLKTWRPQPRRSDDSIRVGWNGSPGSLWHLERLSGVLDRVRRANPAVKLTVLCGQRPAFAFPFEYAPFVPGKETDFVASLDIGLLPLQDDPYTLGKSPIKALQYLACAVPVVGEVRGASAEILSPANSLAVTSEAEWFSAVQRLIDHPSERVRLGEAGRRFAERHHDLREVSRRLLERLAAGG